MVDHKVMREALEQFSNDNVEQYYGLSKSQVDDLIRIADELLDENQNKDAIIEHLRQEVEIHARELSKALDESQALERKISDLLLEPCEVIPLSETIEAQAKEIERLRQLGNEVVREQDYAKQQSIKWDDEAVKLREEIKQLLADKAAAVEALRIVSNVYERELLDYPTALEECVNVADTALQRIGGEQDD